MKFIFNVLISFFIILCGWFAVWPLYEWIVGIRPWFTFLSQNQMILFGIGILFFIPTVLMGKKMII